MAQRIPSVAIGMITGGEIRMETVRSLTNLMQQHAARDIIFHRAPPFMDLARNRLVREFNTPRYQQCKFLLMVDSDIEFTPTNVRRLASQNLPVVSGVYHSEFNGMARPVVFHNRLDNQGRRSMGPISGWPDRWPNYPNKKIPRGIDPLIQVEGTGAGFLMIRRDVLDALAEHYGEPMPWFAEDIREGSHWGEDLTFCHRVIELGYTIFVDRRVQVAHHKHTRLGY